METFIFLRLTQLEVKVRWTKVKSPNTNFHSKAFLSCTVLPHDFKNDLFWCTTIRNARNHISKTSKMYHGLTPKFLRSGQILFHCEMCCWYVIGWYRKHWHGFSSFFFINFGHISGRFTSVCDGGRHGPLREAESAPLLSGDRPPAEHTASEPGGRTAGSSGSTGDGQPHLGHAAGLRRATPSRPTSLTLYVMDEAVSQPKEEDEKGGIMSYNQVRSGHGYCCVSTCSVLKV